jgi:Uma2 family endonuclease
MYHECMNTVRPAKVVWTYQDCQLMPDDGNRYEIIDGELFVTPSPSTTHQRVSKRIQRALMEQLEDHHIAEVFAAPVDVIFSDTTVVEPDLVAVAWARRGMITERGIVGAPDLVVEIASPRTRERDRTVKLKLYASRGVAEYWLVDPERHVVEVLALSGDGYRLVAEHGPAETVSSALFPVELDVDPIFVR